MYTQQFGMFTKIANINTKEYIHKFKKTEIISKAFLMNVMR